MKKTTSTLCLSFLCLGFLLPAAPFAAAASPREELLRLVPQDVGFCLLVQDLREHSQAFLQSPFLAKLCGTPLGAKLMQAPEAAVLAQVKRNFEAALGLPLEQLRDEILGDAFVLAYRPGPLEQPDLEEGLLALRARSPALLSKLVNRINAVQRQAGELKQVETLQHRGFSYQRRTLAGSENFCYQQGGLLLFATGEKLLQDALRCHGTTSGTEAPSVLGPLSKVELEQRLAVLWVNPRAFDAAIQRHAGLHGKEHSASWKTLQSYWQALDGVAVTLRVQANLELGLTVAARKERIPVAGQRFLETAAQPSDLWRCFAQDAILSVAGRVDVAAFIGMVADFVPRDAKPVVQAVLEQGLAVLLHKDLLTRILPQLGPDWGFCVLQPPPGDKALVPPFLLALRIQREGNGSGAPQEVFHAVGAWVEPVVKVFNQLHGGTMGLQSLFQGKVEVKYLADDSTFPAGFRPAFAVKDGYLVIGSSPTAIQQFPAALPAAGTAHRVDEVPFVRFSPQTLVDFLKARQQALTAYLAVVHQLSPADVTARLEGLISVLTLVRRVEVVKQSASGQMTVILRLTPEAPLR